MLNSSKNEESEYEDEGSKLLTSNFKFGDTKAENPRTQPKTERGSIKIIALNLLTWINPIRRKLRTSRNIKRMSRKITAPNLLI